MSQHLAIAALPCLAMFSITKNKSAALTQYRKKYV